MSLQYKAFLYEGRPCRSKEIRRFSVDHDVSSSYEYLRRKVGSVFPNLGEDNFSLQWRDAEGDLIWFNSDEELVQALSEHSGDLFKIFVKVQSTSENQRKEGQPRCGPWQDFSRWQHPFMAFSPGCHGKFPFFTETFSQEQSQKQKKDEDSSKPSTASQQSETAFNADYLQNMGKAVADFLHPFGIDVDINVEHKDKTSKNHDSKQREPSAPPSGGEPGPSASSNSDESASQKHTKGNSPSQEWTFIKKDDKSADDDTEVKMETDDDTRLRDSLNQLLAMGFNDQGGWLTNLLKASDFNISRVLDALQPAQSSKK